MEEDRRRTGGGIRKLLLSSLGNDTRTIQMEKCKCVFVEWRFAAFRTGTGTAFPVGKVTAFICVR